MSSHVSAAVAQSVERRLGKAEVTGSIPVSSSFFCLFFKGFGTLEISKVIKKVIRIFVRKNKEEILYI